MRKQGFLVKLKRKGALKLVEPSEEICGSYIKKSDDCLKSAKLLLQNGLYENSVSASYYAMYDSLTALFFKAGIKCENHSGSILLFRKLFGKKVDLFRLISFAKEERIDKQYYVTSEKDFVMTMESAKDMVLKAEKFTVQIKVMIENLNNEDITKLRKKFNKMFE